MAIGISVSTSSTTFQHKHNPFLRSKPTSTITPTSLFPPSTQKFSKILQCKTKPKPRRTVCLVVNDQKSNSGGDVGISATRLAEKSARKKSERLTYLAAAVMSSFTFTSMAILSVYYRFSWQVEGGEVPYAEMFGTFGLSIGAAVGMEFWARWAHRALWHASMWHVHENDLNRMELPETIRWRIQTERDRVWSFMKKGIALQSHHRPREGPFELNDVIAMMNAIPAIALFNYGFFHRGLIPGLCFGAGLGITVFGIAYMFVHDGLVHGRFPMGPIANVPYLRRVAAAHQLHHSDKFNGVPYGLFLGPQEVEGIGGIEELEKEVNRRSKFSKRK